MAFLRLLNVDPLHQFLATSSNIYNMQHDLSFYRRHGETVLDSIANQHRLTSLFIFIWMMADFLLSSLKSKLSYLTGFAKQRRWHKHPDQTPNTKNNANHQRFMHGMVAMRIILALSFTGRASCVRTRATYMHAAAVKKSRGIQLHRWQSCVSLLLILMTRLHLQRRGRGNVVSFRRRRKTSS